MFSKLNSASKLRDFFARNITASSFNGNSTSATTLIGDETNWASYRSRAVANMLSWKNYGNGHVIFDASNSTSPTGSAVNNTNPGNYWTATYPTLMGWNGSQTYGVRVDTARYAESAGSAAISKGTGVTLSGTSVTWTGLPSGVSRIVVIFKSLSTNGSAYPVVRLGYPSVIQSSGYWSHRVIHAVASGSDTTGFIMHDALGYQWTGQMIITRVTADTWVSTSMLASETGTVYLQNGSGYCNLSGSCDRLSLTTTNGTDTFDAGTVSITYEV